MTLIFISACRKPRLKPILSLSIRNVKLIDTSFLLHKYKLFSKEKMSPTPIVTDYIEMYREKAIYLRKKRIISIITIDFFSNVCYNVSRG